MQWDEISLFLFAFFWRLVILNMFLLLTICVFSPVHFLTQLFCFYWLSWALHAFWMLILCQIHSLQIFSPIRLVVSSLSWLFLFAWYFAIILLVYFILLLVCLRSYLKNCFPFQCSLSSFSWYLHNFRSCI